MNELNELLVTSPDLRGERLEELKRLFPDLFTDEGKLHPESLKQLVDDAMPTRERYEFNWSGKARAKRHAFTPSQAALTYDAERSVSPKMAEGNLIVEGENLEVLKLLTAAYREQVKCIYIDPPYNTGGDYIYPDDYAQERTAYWENSGAYEDGIQMDSNPDTSGRYHSDWLSMMYSRLLVARQLLKSEGVIFVSIDDNEVHNLRKVMDEVFGEENWLGTFVWKSRQMVDNRTKTGISNDHEYILCYGKTGESSLRGSLKDLSKFSNPDNDPRGPWRSADLTGLATRDRRPNLHYDLKDPDTEIVYPCPPKGWRYDKSTMQKKISEGRILFPDNSDGRPRHKLFQNEMRSLYMGFSTIITDIHTADGTRDIIKLFGRSIVEFPKPVDLLKMFIEQVVFDDEIVLDFFAGSGTTAQALMELNDEDDENRRFILVQIPEAINEDNEAYAKGFRTISDITIERCKRVILGHGDDLQPIDTGFKVYRLTKSHFPRVEFQPDPDKSAEENVKLLKQYIAEKESSFQITFDQDKVFDEVLLKHGFMLDYSLTVMNEVEENTLYLAFDDTREAFICLDIAISDATVDYFRDHTDKPFICLERALDTTKKWNLKHHLGDRLKSI